MVIEISTAMLDNLKLTPDEYYIITLVRHKEFDILSEFLKTNYNLSISSSI